ncbi:MAG: transcription antitermination factor NusB [Oscillospiraceae bacterium]|nr:transcription antitermination factor NusB [Oscillospiraceae bacterium]
MSRTAAREIAMHLSFATVMNRMDIREMLDDFFDRDYFATLAEEDPVYAEYPDDKQLSYIRRVAEGVSVHAAELDGYIGKYAKNWQFSRISRVAAAILRTAMYEILYLPEVPYKAAANEAVELAKTYEGKETAGFINGILASFIADERHE